VPPVLCAYCQSSCHDAYSCPCCNYVVDTCATVEQRLNALTNKVFKTVNKRIPEYSHCFNQSRECCDESDSSLGSPKAAVSLYNDFEPSYQSRPKLHDVVPLPSLERASDLPMSLSPNLAPHTSSHTNVIDDVLVSTD